MPRTMKYLTLFACLNATLDWWLMRDKWHVTGFYSQQVYNISKLTMIIFREIDRRDKG